MTEIVAFGSVQEIRKRGILRFEMVEKFVCFKPLLLGIMIQLGYYFFFPLICKSADMNSSPIYPILSFLFHNRFIEI